MIPIESQAVAQILFWCAMAMLIFVAGIGVICHIYDRIDETPEERSQREAERIAKQATKEYKRRQRMRSVKYWNV